MGSCYSRKSSQRPVNLSPRSAPYKRHKHSHLVSGRTSIEDQTSDATPTKVDLNCVSSYEVISSSFEVEPFRGKLSRTSSMASKKEFFQSSNHKRSIPISKGSKLPKFGPGQRIQPTSCSQQLVEKYESQSKIIQSNQQGRDKSHKLLNVNSVDPTLSASSSSLSSNVSQSTNYSTKSSGSSVIRKPTFHKSKSSSLPLPKSKSPTQPSEISKQEAISNRPIRQSSTNTQVESKQKISTNKQEENIQKVEKQTIQPHIVKVVASKVPAARFTTHISGIVKTSASQLPIPSIVDSSKSLPRHESNFKIAPKLSQNPQQRQIHRPAFGLKPPGCPYNRPLVSNVESIDTKPVFQKCKPPLGDVRQNSKENQGNLKSPTKVLPSSDYSSSLMSTRETNRNNDLQRCDMNLVKTSQFTAVSQNLPSNTYDVNFNPTHSSNVVSFIPNSSSNASSLMSTSSFASTSISEEDSEDELKLPTNKCESIISPNKSIPGAETSHSRNRSDTISSNDESTPTASAVSTPIHKTSVGSSNSNEADNRDFLIDDEIGDQPELVLNSNMDQNESSIKQSLDELEALKAKDIVPSMSSSVTSLATSTSVTSSASSPNAVANNTTVFRRPRPLSFVESPDGSCNFDGSSVRSLTQDINAIKTLLFRLQGLLHNAETTNPFDHLNKLGSKVMESDVWINASHMGRSNKEDDAIEENIDLKRQLVLMEQQLEEKDRTIKLLQQQMAKYMNINDSTNSVGEKSCRNSATQTERCLDYNGISPRSVSDGSNGMLVSENIICVKCEGDQAIESHC